MKPVRHAASNLLYRGPEPEIGDLWCWRVQPGEIQVVMLAEPIPAVAMAVLGAGQCEPVGEHGWRGQTIDDVPDVLPGDWAA